MRILAAGASGLIGTPLVAKLRAEGHQVTTLVRRPPSGPDEVQWNPSDGVLAEGALSGVDAVINLAGAGIADHRWTPSYKETVLRSRLDTTGLLARTMAAQTVKPKVFLSASAVGFYGDTGERSVREDAARGSGFLADVCKQWEDATGPAEHAGIRVVHLRTGIVLTPRGGALKQQLLPAKLGLGGRLGTGRQYQSWITLDDELGAITFLLGADNVSGPVNLTAPSPVAQAAFAKALGRILHRPAVAPVQAFAIRLLFGDFADEGILVGQRVLPGVLLDAGYTFGATEVEQGLRQVLDR